MTDLNKIKDLIRLLSGKSSEIDGFSVDDWSINYELDLDEDLNNELANLQMELDLLKCALQENDLITVKCALVMVRLHSLNLSNFFMNIFEDIEKAGWSEGAKLPNVPEGYQVPQHYNYGGRKG